MRSRVESFETWMKAVDSACIKRSGVSIHDLPDVCYRDWYEDGMSPALAARAAIRSEMGDE